MEKWESYRKEIEQASRIGQTITNQADRIEYYKREIDHINPAILQNVSTPNLHLHKGVSEVIVNQKKIPNEITELFKDLNKAKTANNHNKVANILFNIKNETILDQNEKVKEQWLADNPDYADLTNYLKAVNISSDKDKAFEANLHDQFTNLSSQKGDRDVYLVDPIAKDNQRNIGHHVFVISAAIAVFFFVITFVLLIVRWFAF